MRERIHEYFERHQAAILEDLRAMVAFPSTAENPAAIDACLTYMTEKARAWGMETGFTAGRDAAWCEIGRGGETIGVIAHVDVVKTGDMAKWTAPPFQMDIRDGSVFGRGVEDDKGPAVVSLWAMRALMELGAPLNKRIRLILGTSEETQWADLENYVNQFGKPDWGFSPDGAFPVYNIAKGCCDVVATFRGDGAGLRELSAGASPNTVPSLAIYRALDGERLEFHGVSVHSSLPEKGDNAIVKLARFAAMKGRAFGRFIEDYLDGDVYGERLGLERTDSVDGIYVGETRVSPTVLSLCGEDVVVNFNARPRYGLRMGEIQELFDRYGEEYGFTTTVRDEIPGGMTPPDRPFIGEMNAVLEQYGFEGGCRVAGGASYAQALEDFVAWGPVFPGKTGTAHMEDESLPLSDLMLSGEIYTEFLRRSAL